MNRLALKRANDYTIKSYFRKGSPEKGELFTVSLGGHTLCTCKTLESAAKTVIELAKDPWYFDRRFYQLKKT